MRSWDSGVRRSTGRLSNSCPHLSSEPGSMLLYLASILALVGLVGQPTPPAASGVRDRREDA